VRATGRPLVLTERGESAAVVVEAHQYEQIMEELDLLRDIRTSLQQLADGQGVSHDEAKAELRRPFRTVNVVWSPLAIERAYEEASYIAEDKPDAALRWLEQLFASTDRLVTYPRSGSRIPEIDVPEFRQVIFEPIG
jgi:plasmid stabilization system protein ParE